MSKETNSDSRQPVIVMWAFSPSGHEKVEIVLRHDGIYSYELFMHYEHSFHVEEPFWSWNPITDGLSLYDSLEIAQRETIGKIEWLKKEMFETTRDEES